MRDGSSREHVESKAGPNNLGNVAGNDNNLRDDPQNPADDQRKLIPAPAHVVCHVNRIARRFFVGGHVSRYLVEEQWFQARETCASRGPCNSHFGKVLLGDYAETHGENLDDNAKQRSPK